MTTRLRPLPTIVSVALGVLVAATLITALERSGRPAAPKPWMARFALVLPEMRQPGETESRHRVRLLGRRLFSEWAAANDVTLGEQQQVLYVLEHARLEFTARERWLTERMIFSDDPSADAAFREHHGGTRLRARLVGRVAMITGDAAARDFDARVNVFGALLIRSRFFVVAVGR
jgi:hypothetical protein